MTAILLQVKDFSLKWIVPAIDIVLFYMAVFTAIITLPLWSFIEPWANANLHRILSLFLLSRGVVQINFDWWFIFIPRLLCISSIVMIVIKNKTIRQWGFWLASIPFIGIVAISWLSREWSVVRLFSESRFLYFSSVIVAGLYIGLEFKLTKVLRLFEIFFVLVVLGTFFAEIVIREPHTGFWRGFFWWKSYLGEMSGFAAVFFLYRWADFRKNRWFITTYAFVFYLLSVYILYKSNSVTQMLALITVHGVLLLMLSYSRWGHMIKTRHWWILASIFVLSTILAWLGKDTIFGFFGRNSMLTGRMPLWNALVPYIQERFLLGYGFGEAFWKFENYQQAVSQAAGWSAPFAHNGFIEVLLGTGFIGLVFWIIFIVQTAIMSVSFFLRERSIPSMIFLGWIAYTVVINLADNMLGSYENFTVLLLMIAFSHVLRDSLERKKRSADGSSLVVAS